MFLIKQKYKVFVFDNFFTSIKKKIKGAALDLIENEVLLEKRKNNPLIKYSKKNKNIIITPHLGGYTEESVKKTDLFILKKFTEYIKLRN